jgi:hypothetical protein
MPITYRIGAPEDIPAIVALLEAEGLTWPGAASTPYVAVGASGEIELVYFKSICWHAEPLVGKRDSAASVTELAKIMYEDFRDLADEMGVAITVYAGIQNNPKALAAAKKNGMVPMGDYVQHQITIPPRRGSSG